jgi:hypothetical protein
MSGVNKKFFDGVPLTLHSPSDVSSITRGVEEVPIEVTYRYLNSTGSPVHLIMRDGLEFDIPNTPSRDGSLIIQVIYKFNSSVELDPRKDFHKTSNTSATGIHIMSLIEEHEANVSRRVSKTLSYQYNISKETLLHELGGSTYITDLDVVVSLMQDKAMIPRHPYSRGSQRFRLIESETNINNVNRFGMAIYIVSNDGKLKDHWININGLVHRVPSTTDNSLQNGIYLCRSSKSPMTGSTASPPNVEVFTDIEVAREKLRLFETHLEAEAGGDYFAAKETELKLKLGNAKEREQELKNLESSMRQEELKLKRSLEEDKLNADKAAAERKLKFEIETEHRQLRMNDLDHHYKSSSLRDKDYYDNKNYVRKDSSDFIKMLPVLITSTVALSTLVYNFSKR